MSNVYKKALVIFRRDLRLVDHTALLHAASVAESIIPCFIVDPRSVDEDNTFRSLNAIQYMQEAVEDLDRELQKVGGSLYIFHGVAEQVVADILKKIPVDALFVNRDYTPFSIKRDEAIKKVCVAHDVDFFSDHDLLLHEPEEVMSRNGAPYQVFTPFYKHALTMPVRNAQGVSKTDWHTKPIGNAAKKSIASLLPAYQNKNLAVEGMRKEAIKKLKQIGKFADYNKTHDIPSLQTTELSAAIKFGVVSIREVYEAIAEELGLGHPLIRQLFWRDFFTHVAYFSPFVFGSPYKEQYRTLWWDNDTKLFRVWCEGMTGFPIVDAGMRQLNETGYMHNRVRLIVASFLVKDLHIDWQKGERYFATKLVDYDPAVNNGNWQWVASTGTDAQPYFRIFNPWLQQKKFDPYCVYIKRWVPELKNVDPKIIHAWHRQNKVSNGKYHVPCVDHAHEAAESKKRYRMAKE